MFLMNKKYDRILLQKFRVLFKVSLKLEIID